MDIEVRRTPAYVPGSNCFRFAGKSRLETCRVRAKGMKLKLPAWLLLGSGLVPSVLGLRQTAVEASGPMVDQQSLPCTASRASHRQIVVPIERSRVFGAILVNVQVTGKPAVLILDTGSSTTILSPEILGLNPINLKRANTPAKGSGFVGDARWGEATLVMGARIWRDRRILVEDVNDISRAYQRKIDGILGQDILNEFKYVVIDFEDKSLILGPD